MEGILFLVFLLLFLTALTPYLCNRYFLPELLKGLPFAEQSVRIDTISPWKLTGQLSVKSTDNSISLPRLEVHYSLPDLLKGKFQQVIISGLSIRLQLRNGVLTLPQLTSQKQETIQEPKTSTQRIFIEKILLQGCSLYLEDNKRRSTVLANGEVYSLTVPLQGDAIEDISGKLNLTGDIPATLDFSTKLSSANKAINLQLTLPQLANIQPFLPPSLQLSGYGKIKGKIHLSKSYTLQDYSITCELPGTTLQTGEIIVGSRQKKPFSLKVEGNTTEASFSAKDIHLLAPEQLAIDIRGEINFADYNTDGMASLYTPYSTTPLACTFSSKQKKNHRQIALAVKGEKLHIGDISLSQVRAATTAHIQEGKIKGKMSLAVNTLLLPPFKFSKLKVNLPFHAPPQKTADGKFSIAAIRYNSMVIGKVSGTLNQTTTGIKGKIDFHSPMIKDSQPRCKGKLTTTPLLLTTECHIPWGTLSSSNLPVFPSLNSELFFSGKIQAENKLNIDNKGMEGSIKLAIKDGFLQQGSSSITDLNTAITFPDINQIRSSPNQQLFIKNLSSGNIRAKNAKIRWQLEDSNTIFIEKAQMDWCGGKVEAASLRLSADNKELATTLYCDRLRLEEILGQFDIAKTSGNASLNGRLPIILNDQGIEIANGFLFSTPGKQGVIRFSSIREIRDSIPGVNTSPYIEYSLESLKDFAYNWVKLTFNSDQGNLLIKMELDGKPATPLPYRYKNGRMIPLDKGEKGKRGLQHPVQFNVNFHLPMQQMFRYGTGVQSVINTFKESF